MLIFITMLPNSLQCSQIYSSAPSLFQYPHIFSNTPLFIAMLPYLFQCSPISYKAPLFITITTMLPYSQQCSLIYSNPPIFTTTLPYLLQCSHIYYNIYSNAPLFLTMLPYLLQYPVFLFKSEMRDFSRCSHSVGKSLSRGLGAI